MRLSLTHRRSETSRYRALKLSAGHRHKRSNHSPPLRTPGGMRHRCSAASGHYIDRAIFLTILSRRRARKDLYLRYRYLPATVIGTKYIPRMKNLSRILRRRLNNAAIHSRLGRHRPGVVSSECGRAGDRGMEGPPSEAQPSLIPFNLFTVFVHLLLPTTTPCRWVGFVR